MATPSRPGSFNRFTSLGSSASEPISYFGALSSSGHGLIGVDSDGDDDRSFYVDVDSDSDLELVEALDSDEAGMLGGNPPYC